MVKQRSWDNAPIMILGIVAIIAIVGFFLPAPTTNTSGEAFWNPFTWFSSAKDNIEPLPFEEPPMLCLDTDGGFNLNQKGYVRIYYEGDSEREGAFYNDFCDGEVIVEYVCGTETLSEGRDTGANENPIAEFSKQICEFGCQAGKCNEDPTVEPPPETEYAICTNGVKDAVETDVDCGGTRCVACENAKMCESNNDCLSNYCEVGFCYDSPDIQPPTITIGDYQEVSTQENFEIPFTVCDDRAREFSVSIILKSDFVSGKFYRLQPNSPVRLRENQYCADYVSDKLPAHGGPGRFEIRAEDALDNQAELGTGTYVITNGPNQFETTAIVPNTLPANQPSEVSFGVSGLNQLENLAGMMILTYDQEKIVSITESVRNTDLLGSYVLVDYDRIGTFNNEEIGIYSLAYASQTTDNTRFNQGRLLTITVTPKQTLSKQELVNSIQVQLFRIEADGGNFNEINFWSIPEFQ